MSIVTPQLIKKLRERTGVGMVKCKAALDEANGDLEKAIENLRKAGMASAVKKEGREANEGLIGIAQTDGCVALVEVNSETDFVAQNEKFKTFIHQLATEAAEMQPQSLDEFLGLMCKHDPSITIDEYRALIVQSLGENIQIKRVEILPKDGSSSIGVYSHMGGRIVTAVELKGSANAESLAREIAMHIAAEAPEYLKSEDVPAEIKEREKEIARSQVKNKPENIIDKIIEGKMKAFFDQVCLSGQKFVKDPSITIQQLMEKESKASGESLSIERFLRWQVGAK
ncbi:MAG: Elongation factor Ts [Chlamydiae bacterium]|nr:Elongation factor Ts [Chlamydiota bacterium]